jgi:hypothetical protein
LNRRRVSRYLGEFNRVVKDSAYTTEQIQQMLQNADQRLHCIILILCSTGCRIGAIPSLTLGNLTKIPNYNLYKIVFYPGTNNEYYTFCTREAATTGIEKYLNYRKRLGEELSFNQDTNRWEPEDAPADLCQEFMRVLKERELPKSDEDKGVEKVRNVNWLIDKLNRIDKMSEEERKEVLGLLREEKDKTAEDRFLFTISVIAHLVK